ncbi:glycoside hydrolase family 16 protein [Xylariaceae sp. FL0804]|nr:glycoside hydrolase family 16 protein [Xylariaceae sp. FL0804]
MTFVRTLLGLGGLLSLATTSQAAYAIQDMYDSTNFFEGFDFFTGPDPTNGYVQYVDATQANETSLAGYANNAVYLGVDYQTSNPTGGRGSVRVSSKKTYTRGLFIADIAHQPVQQCGQWPAFWMFGPEWPNSGEIDIIEGVNMATDTTYTLHTSAGCQFQGDSWSTGDCNAPGDGGTGCGKETTDGQTFGSGFNDVGGGVYALQWTSSALKIFFFSRANVPADIQRGSPEPASWGSPMAQYSGPGCSIDDHFMNHQIVFDTTFCGDWAGQVFSADPTCSAKASSCEEYVGNNPGDFQDSYWLVNSVKVYAEGGATNGTARRFVA